ncbi:MAG: sugar phosphate isomerase/epimerase family protein [Phycisphaerae bacterium]
MNIGIMDSFLGAGTRAENFRRASQAGADGVEVVYSTTEQASQLNSDHAAELKTLAREHGLAIPSLCIAVVNQTPSLITSLEAAGKTLELLRRAIEVSAEAGASVLLVPFFDQNAIELPEELDRAAEALNELVEPAEQAGVTLGVESSLNADQLEYLLDALTGSPNVKVYYDTANALARKLDPVTFIRDLGPGRLAQVHFKDVRVVSGQPPNYDIPLGEGDVDFDGVMQSLRAVGYDGWIVIEAGGGEDPVESAKRNIAFTRELLED